MSLGGDAMPKQTGGYRAMRQFGAVHTRAGVGVLVLLREHRPRETMRLVVCVVVETDNDILIFILCGVAYYRI